MSEVITTDIAGAMPLDQRHRRLWSAQRTSRWNIENRQPSPIASSAPGARGSHFFRFIREGHAQARPLFERAMELNPNDGETYALLGVSYGVEYRFGWNLDPNLSNVAITLTGRRFSAPR